jgi:hypothetical protein
MPRPRSHFKQARNWQAALVQALNEILRREVPSTEAAIEELERLDAHAFPELDRLLRHRDSSEIGDSHRVRARLTLHVNESEGAEAGHFVNSCHPNGYVREGALEALREYPGRLAFAAALLRIDDWIAPIRATAQRLLATLLRQRTAAALFELVDLVIAMRSRERFGQEWSRSLEAVFLAPDYSAQRWRALESLRRSASRQFWYELMLRAEPQSRLRIAHAALTEAAPRLAMWGLALGRDSEGQDARQLVEQALMHPRPAVRCEGIRRYVAARHVDSRKLLERALFDPASSVREAAAWLLRSEFAGDAASIWREAVDAVRKVDIAVHSLSRVATTDDIDRLLALRQHPLSAVRASVLLGLAHARWPELPCQLEIALCDPAAVVVRTAKTIYQHGSHPLEQLTVAVALQSAPSLATRRQLIGATRLLGKWPEIMMLLNLYATAGTVELEQIEAAMKSWLISCGRRFTRLRATEWQVLADLLADADARRPAPLVAKLRAEIEAAAKTFAVA